MFLILYQDPEVVYSTIYKSKDVWKVFWSSLIYFILIEVSIYTFRLIDK